MKFKAFIFDMDGTIIDTEHIWKQASKDLIETRGIRITAEQQKILDHHTHGLALGKSCLFIKEFFDLNEALENLIQEKSQRAVALYRQEVRFIEGFPQFHQKVVCKQLKNGIATNADDHTIQATQDSLHLHRYFGEHIYGISHVNNVCKPDPAIYIHVAEKLGVKPSECIALEDSAHGINAARNAGMYCIGINTANNVALLEKAHHIINNYEELDLDAILQK